MLKRTALLITAVGLLAIGAGAPAQAQEAYPPGATLELIVDPQIGTPNFPFTATVNGCFPTEIVDFRLHGGAAVSAVCNGSFQASVDFIAPPVVGVYPVTATLLGPPSPQPLAQGLRAVPAQTGERPVTLSDTIEVIADQGPGGGDNPDPGGELPQTGSSGVNSNLAVGAVLLFAGAGLVTVAATRRRNTGAAAT